MNEEKKNGAMRLFGGLSGVDERYLEACENSVPDKIVPYNRLTEWSRKYGKAVAAVFALCVLGAVYVGVQSLGNAGMKNAGPSSDTTQMNEAVSIAPSAALQEAAAEIAMEEEPGEAGIDLYAYLPTVWPGSKRPENGSNTYKSNEFVQESTLTGGMEDYTGSSADSAASNGSGMTVGASGVETARLEAAENAGETANGVLTVQRDSFRLTIRAVEPEPTAGSAYATSSRVYVAEEFDRSCVEEQLGTGADAGTASFGVLYSENGRGVLVEFEGNGTVDEVWAMFESIRR